MHEPSSAIAWMTVGAEPAAWSPGLYAMLGLAPGAVPPSLALLLTFLHPDDSALQPEIDELAAGRRRVPLPLRLNSRDGRTRHVRLVPLDGRDQAPSRHLCVLDSGGEAAARQALARSADTLSACLDHVSDAVLLLAPDGRVLAASRAAGRLFPLGADDDRPLWDQLPALVGDPLWRFVGGTDGDGVSAERWIPALGRWLAYTLVRLEAGVLGIFRDRGELHQLRASFAEASERWQRALDGAGAAPFHLAPGEADDADPEPPALPIRLGPGERSRLAAEGRAAVAERRPIALDLACSSTGGTVRVRAAPVGGGIAGLIIADSCPNGTGATAEGGRSLAGAQVRAARGALRWSVRELALHSGVSVATINRFEAAPGAVTTRDRSIAALRATLTAQGIDFLEIAGRPAIAMQLPEPDRATAVGTALARADARAA